MSTDKTYAQFFLRRILLAALCANSGMLYAHGPAELAPPVIPCQSEYANVDVAALSHHYAELPSNHLAAARHYGLDPVDAGPAEMPPFVDPSEREFHRAGIAVGPDGAFSAAFNPAAFVARDPSDGIEKVYLVVRGEVERPSSDWPRRSLPYLYSSTDGVHFKLARKNPLFDATEWYEEKGGIEDPRYFDMRAQPYIDPKDGRSFDGAIMYTAFDGDSARVAVAYFNHNNLSEFRKGGPIFRDADVEANPLVPGKPHWNKSPAALQYHDSKGRLRNVLYVGEGNLDHGGIMAMESKQPFGWRWPSTAPVIRARAGRPDSGLVESAHAPVIADLPPEIVAATGEKRGIILTVHGDAPPRGYQIVYKVFSLDNPTGAPIWQSNHSYFWPQESYEIHGQVQKVVFVSGLVKFRGKWFQYYGAADSVVGVAWAKAAKNRSRP